MSVVTENRIIAIIESTSAINKLSTEKIVKMVFLFAPSATNIPISFCLIDNDVETKL